MKRILYACTMSGTAHRLGFNNLKTRLVRIICVPLPDKKAESQKLVNLLWSCGEWHTVRNSSKAAISAIESTLKVWTQIWEGTLKSPCFLLFLGLQWKQEENKDLLLQKWVEKLHCRSSKIRTGCLLHPAGTAIWASTEQWEAELFSLAHISYSPPDVKLMGVVRVSYQRNKSIYSVIMCPITLKHVAF